MRCALGRWRRRASSVARDDSRISGWDAAGVRAGFRCEPAGAASGRARCCEESLGRATILKLNAGELRHVLRGTGVCPYPTEMQDDEEMLRGAGRLLERYPVKLVCVTLGARGSLLVTRKEQHRHAGLATRVKDTVGAGDAFTAALTHYYLEGAPLAVLNEAGNRWGAWVASQAGGMPPMPAETLEASERGDWGRRGGRNVGAGASETSERIGWKGLTGGSEWVLCVPTGRYAYG